MKLVKQKVLYFSEGKSDKVYEVDLCENQDLFVVNFRYGRRGAKLRDGTKTVFPVSLEEATKIFDALVSSKLKKGYSENEITGQPIATIKQETPENSIREETILKYLKQALENAYTSNWKVSKIILRAGVLRLLSTTDLIAQFLESNDTFEQHNAITVLASFGNSSYCDRILDVFKQQKFSTIAGRAASAYILKYGNDVHKNTITAEVSNYVSADLFDNISIQYIKGKTPDASLLYYAYLFSYDNEKLRQKVYQLIDSIELKVHVFKSIRYIYRASEIIDDMSFFALVSKRMALSKAGYTSNYIYGNDSWINADEEKQKANPSIAFSAKTKNYFNTATYKKVYELGQHDVDGYIQYAMVTLCALNDKTDNAKTDLQYSYSYNSDSGYYESEKRCFPKYHNFLALMYILYGNSTRFQRSGHKWYYVNELEDTTTREEALPQIWNTKPDAVIQILANAKSDIAVTFSLRILKANPQFLEAISDEMIGKLVSHYHPKVLEVILGVLEQKFANQQPDYSIIIDLLKSKNEKGVTLGVDWLAKYQDQYLSNSDALVELLLTDEVSVIKYLKHLYTGKIPFNYGINIETLEPLFFELNTFSSDFLVAMNDLIGNSDFGTLLSETPATKISELSNSSLTTNKLFAINLAKYNNRPAYELFKDSFDEYINADNALLRQAGIELLAHFPDEFLLKHKQDIVGFCFSEYAEVRTAIQPTIERLVALDRAFKAKLLSQLLVAITEAETYDGLHQNCYELLTKYFEEDVSSISEEQIMTLVLSKYESAQNLGTPIFDQKITLSNLSMSKLVRLGHSDVFSIREKLHDFFTTNVARVNYELEEALTIFNTEWQDVVDWSCTYFDEHIEAKNWTTDLLLYACDHVKPDVQAFGMKMVTKHFSEEKGLPILLKLQEHPTKRMQFFVTNYLDGYAKDNPEVILKLEQYFKTSVFNINTNRVAKTRIYSFLKQEALKNEDVAQMTVRIINSVLDTKTMRDKNNHIDILLAITTQYPSIDVPLSINDVTNEI